MTKKSTVVLTVATLVLAVTVAVISFGGNTPKDENFNVGGFWQNQNAVKDEVISENLPIEAKPYSESDDNGESYVVEGEINTSEFELCN